MQVSVGNCAARGGHCDGGVSAASSYYAVPLAIAIGKYIVTFLCLAFSLRVSLGLVSNVATSSLICSHL